MGQTYKRNDRVRQKVYLSHENIGGLGARRKFLHKVTVRLEVGGGRRRGRREEGRRMESEGKGGREEGNGREGEEERGRERVINARSKGSNTHPMGAHITGGGCLTFGR